MLIMSLLHDIDLLIAGPPAPGHPSVGGQQLQRG
jgi:hypothetical protein